ncbi:hypothetical protein [Hymenobacter cheonanensis]|uniref:hypothetical protein n=1 Tax=Hymenobacter sp. CA2-7 TaxID=3063993 RepID=UPI002713BA3A|nr:hypothetical protein [Hymenobacter sp. CA2-7]MDO7884134.1 hypothetical protein [Hymenobacter sp. CA2-7]
MESLPEAPRPLAPQLSQMPAYRAVLAPTPVSASRVVATLMQLKDTANILLLLSNGALLFGIVCGFGVPGLVLYGLRWRQVRGRAGRGAIGWQAALSLGHELFWAYAFQSDRASSEPFEYDAVLVVFYGLGAFLSAVQLLVALTGATEEEAYPAGLTDEQPVE